MDRRPDWQQQRAFLIRLYFGETDQQNGFAGRAYRDFNRTLRGFGREAAKEHMKGRAIECMRTSLAELTALAPRAPERLRDEFDCWHSSACLQIVRCFAQFDAFNYGQAQKWLNMTIKYRWFFGASDPLNDWISVAHVPVDDYVLRAAQGEGILPPVRLPWSRWGVDAYLDFQNSVREHAARRDMTPLDLEHHWWMAGTA